MDKASNSENFGLNQNTPRCFCLWKWASVPCSAWAGTYSPSHRMKVSSTGILESCLEVSTELEGGLCLPDVWWLWGFLAGLSPLLRGSSGPSNSLCEQSECPPSPPTPLGVCFTKWSCHTFLWGTVRNAQPGEPQGLCQPLPETTWTSTQAELLTASSLSSLLFNF